MAAIVWTDVTNLDAALSAVPTPGYRDDVLTYVNENLNASKFGGETASKTKRARVLLAAHLGALWLRDNGAASAAAAPPVTSETISATSFTVAYSDIAANSSTPNILDETSHGRAYAELVRSSACRVGIVPRCR